MKKFYEAPKLTNHGTVSSITEASIRGTKGDTLFGEDGITVLANLTGSVDACTNGVVLDQIATKN